MPTHMQNYSGALAVYWRDLLTGWLDVWLPGAGWLSARPAPKLLRKLVPKLVPNLAPNLAPKLAPKLTPNLKALVAEICAEIVAEFKRPCFRNGCRIA